MREVCMTSAESQSETPKTITAPIKGKIATIGIFMQEVYQAFEEPTQCMAASLRSAALSELEVSICGG